MRRLLFAVLCLLLLAAPVKAAEPKIVDDAGLLTDAQVLSLEEQAQTLAQTYQIDAVILTVESLDGTSVETYADDYYDSHGYGYGEDFDGVLLLLAMDTREWAISTCGSAIYAITDYGTEEIFGTIAEYLSEDDYYTAFEVYLDQLEVYFDAYAQGEPIDGYVYTYDGPGSYSSATREDTVYYTSGRSVTLGQILKRLVIALAIGAASGGIVIYILRRSMNTNRAQVGASGYMNPGSFRLRYRQDILLGSHVTRTPRNSDDNGGGGGGSRGGGSSVHSSSSGHSHGGGHGRF